MAKHVIRPERSSLHGMFSAALVPAAVVSLGDVVLFEQTLDISWGMGQHDRVNQTREKWGPRESPGDDGIALHGPIFVEGLQPGDTLAITIQELRVGEYGWTWTGNTPLNHAFNMSLGMPEDLSGLLLWALDADKGTAVSEKGHQVSLAPFPGTIGLCPGGEGPHESWFPRRTGGNMDWREVQQGSTLYLPVEVEGGLLSLGDGHAYQRDGELAGSAIECRFERLVLQLEKADSFAAQGPTICHPDGRWATMGFGETLDEAASMATSHMLTLMQGLLSCDRTEALLLASSFVDLRVTQMVNKVRGTHAIFQPPQMLSERGDGR